ncbi:MAG TPA: GNAT family N-acetyltransferase [Candidatus Eisenbacteria bacterium]
MTEWEIRDFRPGDLEEARRLWAATEGLGAGPGDTDEAIGRFLERNRGLSLVALSGGSIVATVLCGHDGRRGILYRVAVAPEWRRRGLAAELTRRCLSGLGKEGIGRCFVFVETDNEGALSYWAAAGFRKRALTILSIDL